MDSGDPQVTQIGTHSGDTALAGLGGALQGLFSGRSAGGWDDQSPPPRLTAVNFSGHFSQYPKKKWLWPNFTPVEIACRHCGLLVLDVNFLDRLQALRLVVGPVVLSNVTRCPLHNAREGGAPGSMHLKGRAGDVQVRSLSKRALRDAAEDMGFTGFGFYNTFLHVDTGRPRHWGSTEGWTR